ncbi:MAG: flavodoxin family protein [Spirochaetales bacterium]|nr:flavodoxin family protein [Spirochaetales bacterium]
MRVGIVYFSNSNNKKLLNIVNSLSEGIELQGHQVDIINGNLDVNSKLTVYNYIAIGIEGINLLGGKIPPKTKTFLSNSGIVRAKRSYAFSLKTGLRPMKTLSNLMTSMEHEGLYLKKSDIISTKTEALNIGKRLHIS